MTVTMTRLQYEADLDEAYKRGVENSQKDAQQAYEQGRADERQHLREVASVYPFHTINLVGRNFPASCCEITL